MLILNYKPVLHHPTGIGVYANAVLPALQKFENVLLPGDVLGGGKRRLKRFLWSQFQLPRLAIQQKADLIFTPATEGYLGDQIVPQVVMVHDLKPLSHPECSMQSIYFRHWVPKLLSQCKHILTNSEFTALEICKATGICEDKISVTPLGFDANHFFPSESVRHFHHRPYLLHIGQAYPHKNLQRLIHAFNTVAKCFPEVDLLLLGKPHPFETVKLQQLASELGLTDRVIFKNYAHYGQLPNWYRGALAFVYPSLWEGFGLPILEAMACGCPVITSYGSALEEVASDNAILVNPLSVESLSDALAEVISSPLRRKMLSARGIRHCSSYSWQQTRLLTYQEISKVLTRAVS